MSDLIVAGFEGEFTADEVMLDLLKMEQVHLIDLDDAAIASRRKDGSFRIKYSNVLVMADAAMGGQWGLVIGTVLLNPLMGTLAGGVVGAATGKVIKVLKKIGIGADFIKEIADTLQPDSSAIFILIRKSLPENVVVEIKKFNGKLLRSSLSPENELELQKVFQESITLKKADPKSTD
jgi:uncharacterized membrane protein